ncbi:P-loop containing nucleoside triphosphate hydrolase [Vigna unguiculata]|uniref:P-loop containing nucleoside triphosphate hydrolase n=1 Tax=Vigna unguiculata TaxID=3917 RepID=A0A4D6NFH2_VIGUN|nr:P-loop containing nucleoside triphosphate hydrolase [Vigna unguiculata]
MGGGGDYIVAHGTEEDSCSEENSLWFSSHSSFGIGDNMILQDESNKIERGSINSEIDEERTNLSRVNLEVTEKIKPSNYLQCSCDELKIRQRDLKREKQKILRYKPGAWIEKVGGLETSDHDVPKTTCLLMVGPSGSGKSSLINRISKVLEDDKLAPARAQESYNSFTENGTYFLQEYMMPRSSNSICLYDTRSLSYNLDKDENIRMLKGWMTKGVRHGELVVRKTDDERLRTILESKAHNKGYFSSETRKVNFVIYVVNGLLVLKAMKNAGALETQYVETIVSTFNCPFLSFKDDKPVLVFTHGDLLSHTERAHVRGHLGRVLGIPPTKQIFDIPDCDCPATASAIVGMLRYSLAHADRSFPQKCKVVDKVCVVCPNKFIK